MSHEVIVDIDEKGQAKIEVNGVVGNSCSVVTGRLIRELGGGVVSDDKKPEFFQTDSTNVSEKQGW